MSIAPDQPQCADRLLWRSRSNRLSSARQRGRERQPANGYRPVLVTSPSLWTPKWTPKPKMNNGRKKMETRNLARFQEIGMERATRFELATKSLGSSYSTN